MEVEGDPLGRSKGILVDLDWESPATGSGRRRILVGKVVTEKALNRSRLETMIQKAWNVQSGLTIVEIGSNSFLFTFEKERLCQRVLGE